MPADQSLRRMGSRLWRRYRRPQKSDPFIADSALTQADPIQLNKLASPPACGEIFAELTATFESWLANAEPKHWVQLVVLPPCDQNDVLRSWATLNRHHIIEPPRRDALLSRTAVPIELDKSASLHVVPRLERWFLRHHNGLQQIQRLLDVLTTTKQHCIVGCSSWAWSYLTKAIQTQLVLPTPLTLEAFDRERLMTWLSNLATSEANSHVFRFSRSGHAVFGEESNAKAAQDYFATLAARSLGIPWVAWHMWRRSLKLGPHANNQAKQKFPNEQTVWVVESAECEISSDQADAGLLILQALLIHDRLTIEELDATIPGIQRSNVLSSLLMAGLISYEAESLRCMPAAYPAIRSRLATAGFPLAPL